MTKPVMKLYNFHDDSPKKAHESALNDVKVRHQRPMKAPLESIKIHEEGPTNVLYTKRNMPRTWQTESAT